MMWHPCRERHHRWLPGVHAEGKEPKELTGQPEWTPLMTSHVGLWLRKDFQGPLSQLWELRGVQLPSGVQRTPRGHQAVQLGHWWCREEGDPSEGRSPSWPCPSWWVQRRSFPWTRGCREGSPEQQIQTEPGVNFISVLRAAFMHAYPKSAKKTVTHFRTLFNGPTWGKNRFPRLDFTL